MYFICRNPQNSTFVIYLHLARRGASGPAYLRFAAIRNSVGLGCRIGLMLSGPGQNLGGGMPNLTIQDILAISPDAMPDFIRQHTSKRTLSRVVKTLNRTLIDGDESARDMAAAALRHLGFDEKY